MADSKLPGIDWESTGIKVIENGEKKQVLVGGRSYFSWNSSDESGQRLAIVQLCELELGTQEEISDAFGVHINSVSNYINSYRADGIRGLIDQPRGPKERWKLIPRVKAEILYLFLVEGIATYEAIQRRLEKKGQKISIESVRQVLIENGLVKERVEIEELQGDIFEGLEEKKWDGQLEISFSEKEVKNEQIEEVINDSEKEKEPTSKDSELAGSEEKYRSDYSQAQRMYLDQLEQGIYNSYAGGLLFVPLLREYNFLRTIKKIINIETHEGYTLDELCLTLFYFDIFRFESMENFKTAYPEEFGGLIGRLSSPSVYTLRRFLHNVKDLDKGEELIDAYAKEYLKSGITKWGVLYIDSHFLPYFGIYCIKMGFHGVRKIPMKGSYNFLAIDERFTPLLFLVRSSSEDLLEKIPEIIQKARRLAKEAGVVEEDINSLIVIFDREGYSAELFRALDGRDKENGKFKARFITWGKYADKWVDDIEDEKLNKTVTVTYEIQEPEEVKYFDTERAMPKYGKIRAIVIEAGRGRAAIYTNDKEISAEIAIQLICRRWGEENLIKELMMKHLIEYFPGYETEDLDEQPMVDNPRVKKIKEERTKLKSELSQIKSKFGHDVIEEMAKGKNWRTIKKKYLPVIADIGSINSKITLLDLEIDKHPEGVRFDEAHGKKLVELNYERKRFLDAIKVFTYNMEKQMCKVLLNYYGVKKEIYPALSMIVKRGGFIKLEGRKLRVQLRRFRNSDIDYAARRLCEDLNQMKPFSIDKFHLPIQYEVL
ncbi:MAG: helix-turn-helix domain containing protein [Candidatus Omnitrophica bacterium]|nr:helix-turn-helix domain containing protein [Candidatus Omnitrophota bacterium]